MSIIDWLFGRKETPKPVVKTAGGIGDLGTAQSGKRCSNCGNLIPEGEDFCPKCTKGWESIPVGDPAKLFGGQRGEYKCSSCGSYFSTEQIQEHARYVGKICSAGLSQMFPGAYSVGGSISVFDNGLAYCPKCIRSTGDISRYDRTVKKAL